VDHPVATRYEPQIYPTKSFRPKITEELNFEKVFNPQLLVGFITYTHFVPLFVQPAAGKLSEKDSCHKDNLY
jgi:hypothetical protein